MKLFKVLIGCKPKGRQTEQHDVFFGVAENMQALVPQLKTFWPEAVETMHFDAFREVTMVGEYSVSISYKETAEASDAKLFFINLGGYKPSEFDEFHYKIIVAATDKATAIQQAKQTTFYKHCGFKGATSHIDDKYGIDVDDAYAIEDILAPGLKEKYAIVVKKTNNIVHNDTLHLGYYKLSKIENGLIEAE
jgi:Domain of Unknown Function (DUF1543)